MVGADRRTVPLDSRWTDLLPKAAWAAKETPAAANQAVRVSHSPASSLTLRPMKIRKSHCKNLKNLPSTQIVIFFLRHIFIDLYYVPSTLESHEFSFCLLERLRG